MGAVDFEQWAVPSLVLTLGGRTYRVPPPSVDRAKLIIAAAVRGEVRLGLVQKPLPAEVQAVLDTIDPDDHPALTGEVYQQMLDDGHDQASVDRMAYYAVFYWARGKGYADELATILWTPRDLEEESPAEAADAVPFVSR
jgi:hypothetical protein